MTESEFHPVRSKYLVITADFIVPIAVTIAVAALWWIVFHTGTFAIRTIVCTSDGGQCKDTNLLAELAKYKGKNIFQVNTDALAYHLESADYMIKTAVVTRTLPGSLAVALQSVSPVVALQVAGQNEWMLFDGSLRLIGSTSTDPSIPTVLIQTPITLAVGKSANDGNLRTALEIAEKVGSAVPGVKDIALVDAETIRLDLSSGQYALLTTGKPVDDQIRLLQAVLKDATIVQDARGIDVRFNQPVLKPL